MPVPPPQDRKPYHTHKGGNMELVVLDSGHYCRTPSSCVEENDQVEWLERTLAAITAPVRMTTYHVPLYPSELTTSHLLLLVGCRADLDRLHV